LLLQLLWLRLPTVSPGRTGHEARRWFEFAGARPGQAGAGMMRGRRQPIVVGQ
jgi:hypothetical protein